MTELAYVTLCGLGVLLAGLAATAAHYAHAFLMAHPDKLFEGHRWRDHALNNFLNNRYVSWADYDEDGWWEFYSVKNYCYYLLPTLFIALMVCAYFWPARAAVVAAACRGFANIGMQPLFCG